MLTAQSVARAALTAHQAGLLVAQAVARRDTTRNFYRTTVPDHNGIGCAIGVAVTLAEGLELERCANVDPGKDAYSIDSILTNHPDLIPHIKGDLPAMRAIQKAHDLWVQALLNKPREAAENEQQFLSLCREHTQ